MTQQRSIVYKDTFDAAHILDLKDSPCGRLHGHLWQVKIEIREKEARQTDMIVDFNLLKDILKKFDHKTIINDKHGMKKDGSNDPSYIFKIQDKWYELPISDVIRISEEPTCENLAEIIYDEIHMLEPRDTDWLVKVTLNETEKGQAQFGDF